MLKKLLKYDFKYIFKYWWIAAVTSVVFAVLGGACITVLSSQRDFHDVIRVMATLTMVLVIISFGAFALLTVIMNFARFYKNFFSDEGYLTFTLPAKKGQLLNSKLITSTVSMIATSLVLIIDVILMLVIAYAKEIFTKEFFEALFDIIKTIFEEISFLTVLIGLEVIIVTVLSFVFSLLFLYCCITLGSIVTKKAKVITAIAIYYGANMVFTTIVQIFVIFSIPTINNYLSNLNYNSIQPMIFLGLLVIILFFGIFCTLLYTFQYWMLDRKLNLS